MSLIGAIVARESGEPHYMLDEKDVEVEHIWSNHFGQHADEFDSEDEFAAARNSIGDLLVLPNGFNSSYGAEPYTTKVDLHFGQNMLAQTLSRLQYKNAPGFKRFREATGLPFKPYEQFTRSSITERADLYKGILLWNWR